MAAPRRVRSESTPGPAAIQQVWLEFIDSLFFVLATAEDSALQHYPSFRQAVHAIVREDKRFVSAVAEALVPEEEDVADQGQTDAEKHRVGLNLSRAMLESIKGSTRDMRAHPSVEPGNAPLKSQRRQMLRRSCLAVEGITQVCEMLFPARKYYIRGGLTMLQKLILTYAAAK